MPDISLANAAILGTIFECVEYGFLTSLYFQALVDLTQRRRTKNVNKILVGAATILWVLASAHMAIVCARTVTGFIQYADAEGGATYYLAQMGNPVFITMQSIFVCINAVTDALMVYRTWIMWDEKFYIIIPFLCSMGGAGISAIISVYYQSRLQIGQTFASIPIIVQSADALFAFALFTNLGTTCLIVARIIYLMHAGRQMNNKTYISIIGIIVESGVLMAVAEIVQIGLWSVQYTLEWTWVSVLAQVMAISPMLIIVRASANSPANQSNPLSTLITTLPNYRQNSRRTPEDSHIAMGPVVLTEVMREYDGDEAENGNVSHLDWKRETDLDAEDKGTDPSIQNDGSIGKMGLGAPDECTGRVSKSWEV